MRINCLIPEKRSSCVPCCWVRDILENVWKISHFFWTWSATLLRMETSRPIVCKRSARHRREWNFCGRPFLNGNNERSSSDQKKTASSSNNFFRLAAVALHCVFHSTNLLIFRPVLMFRQNAEIVAFVFFGRSFSSNCCCCSSIVFRMDIHQKKKQQQSYVKMGRESHKGAKNGDEGSASRCQLIVIMQFCFTASAPSPRPPP